MITCVDFAFELIIRGMCFVVICSIFLLMEFGSGLTPTQLKVLTIVWLMSTIHCGAVDVYPVETLVVLTITVSPMFAKFVSCFPETYIKKPPYNQNKKNIRAPAHSPSSPSSVQ